MLGSHKNKLNQTCMNTRSYKLLNVYALFVQVELIVNEYLLNGCFSDSNMYISEILVLKVLRMF